MSAQVGDLLDTRAGSLPVSEGHPGRPLAEAPGEGDEAPDCWPGMAVADRSGRLPSVKRRKIYGSDPDQKLHLLARVFLAETCVKNQTVRRTRFQGFLATLSGAALRRLPGHA